MIEGNRIVETGEIMQLIKIQKDAPIHNIDLMGVRKDVLSHYFIKDALVERDLPSTLRITVTERSPLAIVNGAELLYLDEEGVVLPHSISKQLFDLPFVTGIPAGVALRPGSTIHDPNVGEALAILTTLKLVSKELFHLVSEVRMRGDGDVVLYAAERGVPIIFGRGNVADKLVRLETFWNEVVREQGSEKLQYVDVRFDDQVVVRWNL
jgi:cell division protein FtsQ